MIFDLITVRKILEINVLLLQNQLIIWTKFHDIIIIELNKEGFIEYFMQYEVNCIALY